MKKIFLFFTLYWMGTIFVSQAQSSSIGLQVPGKSLYTHIDRDDLTVLPSGRFVKPVGKVSTITHDPFGLTVSKDGKYAVSLHNGVLTIYHLLTDSIVRVPDYKRTIPSPFTKGSLLGATFYRDNKTIFLSGGDNGNVIAYDVEKLKVVNTYTLDGKINDTTYQDSFTSDLLYNEQNNELLVLDQANYRLVRIDCTTKNINASIPVGRLPFGLALSPDHQTAIVANVGMYAYPMIEGINEKNYNSMLIPHHPYAHVSNESKNGTTIDGKKIPGVGDPNVEESMSVFTIDLSSNKVTSKLKTGYIVGQMVEDAEVIGGSSPNSIAVNESFAYVTNATNDNIAVIDYRNGKLLRHIQIQIDQRIDKYRGYLPFGIELSKDGSTLYTALLGFNAVAVIDTKTEKTIGVIPTGWGPTRVKLSPNQEELYIISCRGFGAGPNGGKGFVAPPQGTYIGDIQLATFQRVKVPDFTTLKDYTNKVLSYTFVEEPITKSDNPMPNFPGEKESPIKYIVYITKENRTYDEVFGQLPEALGDSTLSRFGMGVDVRTRNKGKDSIALKNVNVSPNHHKAAKKYAFSDNFYCDSDASIHGHHWMMGVIPNEWVETNSNTSKTAKYFSPAPGRRYPGSTGSMDPEDYAEIGGLWEALERKGISFYNFGEANETAHVREEWMDTATGAGHGVMVPMQKALFSRTSHNYAGFNTNIPDQFRMNQFESEFKKMWLSGKEKMPSLITMQVPNDHGAGSRPDDGYLFPQSFMADNDLAVGRILHFLSRTPYWKNMLVIITEDDPQGGVDHIDAHRSILMMAGPYVKRNYVSHTHANFGSILKTIYNILAVPYVNQYDVTASNLSDFFTSKPDFSVYTLENSDKRIFDPSKAMKRYNRDLDWRKIMKGPEMDDEDEIRKIHYKK
ncbi:MAG: phosphoesterase [Chitinophagia bacterium]|nr:phosphoesterase [Chitinophagia bacterium]